ncbi:glycosyltransferase [Blastococcus sp. SYSU D00695]
MRVLVVADEYPWPARSGYRQRLHWVLRGLTGQGEVDLLVARARPPLDPAPPPPEVPLRRLEVVTAGQVAQPRLPRTLRWLAGTRPRSLTGRDWSAARALAATWARDGHDVVWFSHSPLYLALSGVLPAPHVVDLDNLESSLLRHRRMHRDAGEVHGGRGPRARVRRGADAVDERRWRRLEARIAGTAAVTVVCSELDRGRLPGPRVRVLPNGYEPQPAAARPRVRATGAAPASAEPVLLFVGLLTYAPNRDAVAFFAREVLPLVRAQRPAARLRVVGRHGPGAVQALRGLAGVELVGEAADMAAELAAADLSVVPIRFGGGTRIKVLEAFAHGVPVVSTTVGCEGLDVVDGVHLRVADGAPALAAACLELLERDDRRAELSARAHALWADRYRWTAIAPAVGEIVGAAREGAG